MVYYYYLRGSEHYWMLAWVIVEFLKSSGVEVLEAQPFDLRHEQRPPSAFPIKRSSVRFARSSIVVIVSDVTICVVGSRLDNVLSFFARAVSLAFSPFDWK